MLWLSSKNENIILIYGENPVLYHLKKIYLNVFKNRKIIFLKFQIRII